VLDYGFVLDEEAKAFFTAAESFAQLQDNELSSQRVDFDRSTGRLAGSGGQFVGVNTIGSPAG
jgi:protein subunit release factor B